MPGFLARLGGGILHRLWRMTKGWSPYGRLIYEDGGSFSGGITSRADGTYSISPTPEDLFEIYPSNPWLATCIGAKALAVAGAPWGIWKPVEGAEAERVHGHPAEKLLYDPDKNETWEQTAQRISMHLDVAGAAYLEISRNDDGTPGRLSVLYPPAVTVVVHPDDGISSYEHRPKAGLDGKTLMPEDVVYMRHPHPQLDYKGFGTAQPAGFSTLADSLGRRWNLQFFRRGAQPDTILTTEQDVPKSERAAILDEWMAKHSGGKGRGVAMLPFGLKATTFGAIHREMQFRDLMHATRDEIVAAMRVAPIMVGIREGANYATAYTELEIFRELVLLALLRAIFGPLTSKVLWAFPGAKEEGLFFAPDIEAMMTPEEKGRRDAANRQDFASGLSTRAEARKRLGYPEEMDAKERIQVSVWELRSGVVTIDEAREAKGMAPHPNREIGPLTVPEMDKKLGITATGAGAGPRLPELAPPAEGVAKSMRLLGAGSGNGNGHRAARAIKTLLALADGEDDGDDEEDAAPTRRLYIPYRMEKARKAAEDPIASRVEAIMFARLKRQRDAVVALIGRKLAKYSDDQPRDEAGRFGSGGGGGASEKVKAWGAKAKAGVLATFSKLHAGSKAQLVKTRAALATAGRMVRGDAVTATEKASALSALADVGRLVAAGSLVALPGGMLALAVAERAAKHFGGSLIPAAFAKGETWTDAELDAVLEAMADGDLKKADDPAPDRKFTKAEILKAIAEPLTKQVQAQLRAAVKSGGNLQADAVGIKFREADPGVSDYLNLRRTNLEDVLDATTADRVKAALDAGYANSESEEDMLRRVEGTDEEGIFSRARARTIARTETHAAVMSGAHVAMKQAGVQRKQWLAASDDRTRDAHLEASGQIVDIDEPFIVDGEELDYPGDPSGSPENVINCRCTTLSLFDNTDTSPKDLTDALDMTGDSDAQDQVEEAVKGEVDKDQINRIKPDDVERLRVAAGDGAEVEYDPGRSRLTVGPDASASDVADGVREHLVNSLVDKADARGFMNVVRLAELPEAKVRGGEIATARATITAVVNEDWEGLETMTGVKLTERQKAEYRTAAANFWIGPTSKAPVPVRREATAGAKE